MDAVIVIIQFDVSLCVGGVWSLASPPKVDTFFSGGDDGFIIQVFIFMFVFHFNLLVNKYR